MNAMTRVVAVALLALAAGGSGEARAAPSARVRTFRIEAQGVQTTTWTESHQATSICDQSTSGSGSEKLTFHSARPETVVAYGYGGHFVTFGPSGQDGDQLQVRATVTRHGHVAHGALDPRCLGAGGGGTPPAPDCGRRRSSLDLSLGWVPSGRTGITLQTGIVIPLYGLFQNCPVIGDAFPELLDSVGNEDIVARIPASDLFDPSLRGHIVFGHGRVRRHSGDSSSTTSIHWTLSLTAVR